MLGQTKAAQSELRDIRDTLWHDGRARGERLGDFVEDVTGSLKGKRVLDLGCAAGGITRVLGERSGAAVGVDNQRSNVRAAQERHAAHVADTSFVLGSGIELPFHADAFDVVLMSGLLEWMGFARPAYPPHVGQGETLREVLRILSPGGRLFVGIENRWFPKFLYRSPHQGLRFALLMPARLSWALPAWLYGEKVHERLYGPRGLRRLLGAAGFDDVSLYIPIFGYQFPRAILHEGDGRGIMKAINNTELPPRDDYERVSAGGARGRRWLRIATRLGVQAWLAPCLLAMARKSV